MFTKGEVTPDIPLSAMVEPGGFGEHDFFAEEDAEYLDTLEAEEQKELKARGE